MEANGYMPKEGLCENLGNAVKLFQPTEEEYPGEDIGWYHCDVTCYLWGYDGTMDYPYETDSTEVAYRFTEFRQTIVLFLAAMNDEL